MSEISDLFSDDSNRFADIKAVVEITGDIVTGAIVPKSDTVTDNEYSIVKKFYVPSAAPAQIVNDRYKKVFKKDITRFRKTQNAVNEEYFTALDENVDDAGTKRTPFLKGSAKIAASYDFGFVVMDDYPASEKPGTQVDQIAQRAFAFFENIEPQSVNIPKTIFNRKDQLIQFAYDFTTTNEEGEEVVQTKVITETEYRIEEDDKVIESTPYDISLFEGNFPVKIYKIDEDKKNNSLLSSTPSIYGACKSVIGIGMLDAGLDYSLFRGNFSQLVVAASKTRRLEIKAAQEAGVAYPMGIDKVMIEDADQKNSSYFLSPKIGDADSTTIRRTAKFEQTYREAGKKFSQGGTASSAESKVMDQDEINTALADMANIIQDVDKWIDMMFAYSLQIELLEVQYDYPDEFGLKSVQEQTDNFIKFFDTVDFENPTAQAETMKGMAKLQFEDESLEIVIVSIDDWLKTKLSADESGIESTRLVEEPTPTE
jgi:hypothetical protein